MMPSPRSAGFPARSMSRAESVAKIAKGVIDTLSAMPPSRTSLFVSTSAKLRGSLAAQSGRGIQPRAQALGRYRNDFQWRCAPQRGAGEADSTRQMRSPLAVPKQDSSAPLERMPYFETCANANPGLSPWADSLGLSGPKNLSCGDARQLCLTAFGLIHLRRAGKPALRGGLS